MPLNNMNKRFIKHFVEAFGTLASLATLIAFVYKWDTANISLCGTFLFAFFIILVCGCYALYQIQPKNSITLLMRDFRINISFGDETDSIPNWNLHRHCS